MYNIISAEKYQLIFVFLNRIAAFLCILSTLYYWSMVIGLSEGGAMRFDVLPTHWKIVSSALSVLFPVAAVGLWMLTVWSAVIWLCAVIIEFVMYFGLSELYGTNDVVIIGYMVIAVCYMVLKLLMWLQLKNEALTSKN